MRDRIKSLELEPHLLKSGVKPEALDYVTFRLREVYQSGEGGALAPKVPASTPSSWHRWVEQLRHAEPHLFGSSRTVSQGARGSDNPWHKDSFNLTRQARLVKSDPGLARQMAAECGITIS